MRTLKLVLEYDGTAYCGWQRQRGSAAEGAPSVQATLEAAVRDVTGEAEEVIGAGRTDAGVHALGQVAGLRTASLIPVDRFPGALNAHLPLDLRVLSAEVAPDEFHARRDATRRTYQYDILNRPAPTALLRNRVYHVPEPLDLAGMRRALTPLVGRHDFVAYRGVGTVTRTTVCTVFQAGWEREGDLLRFTITADRFLRHMVRILVGTLLRVGMSRLSVDAPASCLADTDNRRTGPTTPPHGLYLVRVDYDRAEGRGPKRS